VSGPSIAQLERKQRSAAQLRAEGIPVLETLPCIEDESEIKRRSEDEVMDRAIALMAVAGKGERAPVSLLARFIDDFGVRSKLTPLERAFIESDAPAEKDYVQFSWRYEALRVLFWSLQLLPLPRRPETPIDPAEIGRIFFSGTERTLRQRIRLRSAAEVLDRADLLYRYHWAVRNARLRNRPLPEGIHPGVLLEWDHAARWLIGYQDQEWDKISCDT
jgi:hypothetical protein